MLSPKIIVGRTVSKGVGHHLATVAKTEKIQLPKTNSNETRHVYNIWYAESEYNSGKDRKKRGGAPPSDRR